MLQHCGQPTYCAKFEGCHSFAVTWLTHAATRAASPWANYKLAGIIPSPLLIKHNSSKRGDGAGPWQKVALWDKRAKNHVYISHQNCRIGYVFCLADREPNGWTIFLLYVLEKHLKRLTVQVRCCCICKCMGLLIGRCREVMLWGCVQKEITCFRSNVYVDVDIFIR